jgi:lambda repressor-like predicted transcriptional regulator
MLIDEWHREDVSAALRKKHGSIADFERAEGLPQRSVYDVLRGRPNARVRQAVERVLVEQLNMAAQPMRRATDARAAA